MANTLARLTVLTFLGLACAALSQGCGPRHAETFIGPLPPSGARFKVLYPLGLNPHSSSEAGNGHQYVYTWDCGKFSFEVVDASLKVNDRDYGILKTGDEVIIDGRQELKVTVNDVERAPAAERK
jgi:hypothetical protein